MSVPIRSAAVPALLLALTLASVTVAALPGPAPTPGQGPGPVSGSASTAPRSEAIASAPPPVPPSVAPDPTDPDGPAPLGTGEGGGCRWGAPVTAAVSDPFRAPPGPYGPGNRGIEYSTAAGDPVVAVDAGVVGFVGPVGGDLYVAIDHPSGLRSTVGPLVDTAVVRGQGLDRGEVVGHAAPGLHLTARSGRRYLDPASLLAGRCGGPYLVPLPGAPTTGPR